MKKSLLQELISEISTFADTEKDIECGKNGVLTFVRQGKIYDITLVEKETGSVCVLCEGKEYSYKEFLADIANLQQLAQRIKEKQALEDDLYYVDPEATLLKGYGCPIQDKALDILKSECDAPTMGGTKISFVTADAGHGKTFLLRKFEHERAESFLKKWSTYIFWHIDLHGRDLVRLNEAIMYELAMLRISGLYYNSIITLIKNGLIVLGIDGFDELAAEIGGEKALGSLTNLVMELDGSGNLVAASRRTFFNTQDYLRRSGLLQKSIDGGCEFDEIRLWNWRKDECVKYINSFYNNSLAEYVGLATFLKSSDNEHPLLNRPFLFTKIVKYASEENKSLYDFVSESGSDFNGINNILRAFVSREVQKWTTTDKETGKPYLSFEQHLRFLQEIAAEMWSEQKDYISVETIQFLLTLLIQDWDIEESIKPRIIKMSESHALLVVSDAGDDYRKFDHDEFKNYFLALSLIQVLTDCYQTNVYNQAMAFLKRAQLPDPVAQYMANQLPSKMAIPIVKGFIQNEVNEWKPTYLQPNLGTIIPYILDRKNIEETIEVKGNITFSSLVFENKKLQNLHFDGCMFVNISFKNTEMCNVSFDNCTFTDIRFYKKSDNSFTNVFIHNNCIVNMVTIVNSHDQTYSEYSPVNISNLLNRRGIMRDIVSQPTEPVMKLVNPDFRKTVKRFLNKFIKSSFQYEKNIKEDPIYNAKQYDVVIKDVIPLLLKYDIIEEKNNKNTHLADTKAWALKKYDVAEIYTAEEDSTSEIHAFWEDVYAHD